ncbi:hypothetical protein AB0D49_30845 [Streptomyces sp. NPDC048290]|uniref:hypothetical protein n=1 Tax=Streptomyces sp. NPDC048290 TaxID=3155811 RepID=UPI003434B54C
MTNKRTRNAVRLLTGTVAALAVGCWLPAGAAHADETHSDSHNGPTVGLVNVHVGQVDDPAEDVLEHFRLFGDEHTTEGAAAAETAAG